MIPAELFWPLLAGFFAVAVLYASVGHAGASGYIAVMGLLGVAAAVIRPTALTLNIAVGLVVALTFARAGHFRWPLFWPFAVSAVPMALLGGTLKLPGHWLQWLLGVVLLVSALHFFWKPAEREHTAAPGLPVALGTGAALGLLAGLSGTGGGIFLTPLMLILGWAGAKQAAAVSAWFIVCNSVAGLAGLWLKTGQWPGGAELALVGAAVAGGAIGSRLGATALPALWIKRLLACVLLVAAYKLLFG
jgi:uncharacterized protein